MSAPSIGGSSTGPGTTSAGTGKPDRLYVGNLAPTVDEYTLIQVLQKYGKITKLDFMFHKSGELKGKPRGYAFVEFSNKDDALKAMVKLHDRLLRGRKLVVTYANSAPPTDLPLHTKGRRSAEASKPTTLSLLKNSRRPHTAAAQIAAMEAKLSSMNKRKPADEDYVPGQTFRSHGSHGSNTASPAPDGIQEMDETPLGEEEAGKAADDLEKEMMEELGGHTPHPDPIANTSSSLPTLAQSANLDSPAVDSPQPADGVPSLPPKPAAKASPPVITSTASNLSNKLAAGLAGLPKKPAF